MSAVKSLMLLNIKCLFDPRSGHMIITSVIGFRGSTRSQEADKTCLEHVFLYQCFMCFVCSVVVYFPVFEGRDRPVVFVC